MKKEKIKSYSVCFTCKKQKNCDFLIKWKDKFINILECSEKK